jgi:FMN phosphatase YigB (HAD superfamily)
LSLDSDYEGAKDAGMHAILLRRPGPEGEHAHKDVNELLDGVDAINGLNEILQLVESDQSV